MSAFEASDEQADLGGRVSGGGMRWTFRVSATVVVAYLASLILRQTGAHYAPVDGWGVAAFEVAMGVLCLGRYFDRSWRSSQSTARAFPLVLGTACLSWAVGDVTLAFESMAKVSDGASDAAR